MTDAIRLIQGIATPTQINRIVDWNRKRNNFELNSDLEIDMLREEVKEYFDAETFVDQMDAVCDVVFVAVGTVAKSAYGFHISTKELFSPIDFVLTDFVGRAEAEGIAPEQFMQSISVCLDIVIDANEQKGTERDEAGKVIKPAGFVPPEETIAAVLESFKNADDSQEVAKMFAAEGE